MKITKEIFKKYCVGKCQICGGKIIMHAHFICERNWVLEKNSAF